MNYKIYIDRLAGGKVETIDENLDPSVMKVTDDFLFFDQPVKITGKVYLAEDFLVLNLNIETKYKAPCKICSETLEKPFLMEGVYLTEEVSNVRAKVFDATGLIRDTIFLEIPDYHECEGNCPMRKQLKKFLNSSEDNLQNE